MKQDRILALLSQVRDEILKYESLLQDPEAVLDFYDPYGENIVQQILRYKGCSDQEIFRLVVERLKELPMLSRCTLKFEAGVQRPPVLISTNDDYDIQLFKLDLHGRRYVNLLAGLIEKQDAIVQTKERELAEAQRKLVGAKEIFPYYLLDANNKFPSSARGPFEEHLKDLGYGKKEIQNIRRNITGFYDSCQENVKEHELLVNKARLNLMDERRALERIQEQHTLSNITRDLQELLHRHGYGEDPVFSF